MNSYQRRAAERKSIREKMIAEPSSGKNRAIGCLRCNGCMTLERFGSKGNYFAGMRCMLCGDVIDPIILLHRVSRDPLIRIPEKEEEILLLIERYSRAT